MDQVRDKYGNIIPLEKIYSEKFTWRGFNEKVEEGLEKEIILPARDGDKDRMPREKKDFYEEVTAISGHNEDLSEFRIHWKYSPKSEWLSIDRLDGCLELLQAYCEKHGFEEELKLPLRYAGAGGKEDDHNVNNWWTLESAIAELNRLVRQEKIDFPGKIEMLTTGPIPKKVSLLLLRHDFHIYVLLWLPGKRLLYVSDSANKCLESSKTRKEINSIFPKGSILRAVPNPSQYNVDGCAAYGVAIGLELIRRFKEGTLNSGSTNKLRRALINRLLTHSGADKSKSSLPTGSNILNRVRLQCPKCGWTTNKSRKQALACHIRRAHGEAKN